MAQAQQRRLSRAIVVGAGLGGPVLAMWLRKLGIEVLLAEARDSAALGEGAFLGVAPNGMNALEELGLASAVAAHGHACDSFRFTNRHDRSIGVIDRSEDRARFGWPLTMIRRGVLHALLADEARRRGVELAYDRRLVALDRSDPARVRACFHDGSVAEGDVLFGADGLRSTVRSLALADAPAPEPYGLLDFGGFATVRDLPFHAGVNAMVFGRRAFFGAFTTPEGETWWFHNGPVPASEQELHVPLEKARQRLIELHRDDPPWTRELIRATPQLLGPWPMYELRAMPRWSDGRVALIGDAAHAMSPSAGQGASLAFEDALVVARCLRECPEDPPRAFARYEQQRRARVDAIFEQARRSGSGKAVSSPVAEWLRDRMLPLFLRFGAAAQTKAYGHKVAWEDALTTTA